MRLLHTKELRFQEFFDADVPEYAILSHRWGLEEVSYQEFLMGAKNNGDGYRKIFAACAYAANDVQMLDASSDEAGIVAVHNQISHLRVRHFEWLSWVEEDSWVWVESGFEWIWIDTCCINKSSSAELSEAINSMYQWYARSEVCYAYLADVMGHSVTDFANSQWFTRGWTLQELLAPKTVVFLSKQWQELGQKSSMACIDDITGIPALYVNGLDRYMLADISAAEKFGWAANRQTSRKEDRAYCLLGLFDVSMPLLYGEGDKAFQRLQRKILKSSKDESIFLWDRLPGPFFYYGLLAESIDRFARPLDKRCDLAKRNLSRIHGLTRSPYLVTNLGLQFSVPRELAREQEILLPLNYGYFSQDGPRKAYAIRLEKFDDEGSWARFFSKHWSDCLPALNRDVGRVPGSLGLFVVPADWVWSREELSKTGSEIIYMMVNELDR